MINKRKQLHDPYDGMVFRYIGYDHSDTEFTIEVEIPFIKYSIGWFDNKGDAQVAYYTKEKLVRDEILKDTKILRYVKEKKF